MAANLELAANIFVNGAINVRHVNLVVALEGLAKLSPVASKTLAMPYTTK